MIERGLKTTRYNACELVFVMRDAAPRAAKGEAGTDDQRPGADCLGDGLRLLESMGAAGLRHIESEILHRRLEELTIFGPGDRLGLRTDQFDTVAPKNTRPVEFHREIQRGLSAECRQERIRTFTADDLMQRIDGQRLDVRAIGAVRIGHHRRRIRIHEHDLVPLILQRLDGLHARIVEFAALPDDNRPRADDKNLMDIGSFHETLAFHSCFARAPRGPVRRTADEVRSDGT